METLKLHLSDNRKARIMNSNGSYSKVNVRNKELINSQETFYQMAQDAVIKSEDMREKKSFQPIIRKNEL